MSIASVKYILKANCDLCGKPRKKSLCLRNPENISSVIICRDCLVQELYTLDKVSQIVVDDPLEGE